MAQFSQETSRQWAEFLDQHGRRWGAMTENKSRHATGPFQPQFTAPWLPNQHYIDHLPGDMHRVAIDYDQMAVDFDEAMRMWVAEVQMHAANQPGVTVDEELAKARAGKPLSLVIAALCGPPPGSRDPKTGKYKGLPPKAVIAAAKAGNPWILGQSHEMPEAAREMFPDWGREKPREVVLDPWGTDGDGDPWADDAEPDADSSDGEYPRLIKEDARLPGVHEWELSNGERVFCGEEKAMQKEAKASAGPLARLP